MFNETELLVQLSYLTNTATLLKGSSETSQSKHIKYDLHTEIHSAISKATT